MNIKNNPHTIVIVDDHALFASSLERLINSFDNFKVLFHSKNGKELQTALKASEILPNIILLDINMPVMDGYETAEWLFDTYPDIKVLALSMDDDEKVILKMLQKGIKGYLLKDIQPEKLNLALEEVMDRGYYHSRKVSETLLHSLQPNDKPPVHWSLKENELIFLKLACSEMTYKEIAEIMHLSPKTIDGYRQDLFEKLKVRNRVGLVLFALKNNLATL